MKLFKLYIILGISLVISNLLNAQVLPDSLSLEELLKIATEQSILRKEATYNRESAELNYEIFKSTLKPQIIGNANVPNYSKTYRETTQPDGTVLFQPITNNNSAIGLSVRQVVPKTGGTFFLNTDLQRFDDFENKQNYYNGLPIRIGFSQPLFGFNPFKWNKKIEPLKVQEAQKKYNSDIENINQITVQFFFRLLMANQNLEIAENNETTNQKLYELATVKHKLGKISYNDLLQLKLELTSASKDKQSAEQAVRDASAELSAFLGIVYEGQMIYSLAPNIKQLDLTLEKAINMAKLNRPEMDTYERMLIESEQNIDRANAETGLQANLRASFGFVRSSQNLGDIYTSPQQEQLVQLTLNVPIWDWGRRKYTTDIAKAEKQYVQAFIQQERLTIENEIKQLIARFNNLKKELEFSKEIKTIANERFDITRKSFVLGAISITELSIAQREKAQSFRAYIDTLSQYWQTYFALRQATLYDFEKQEKL